MPGSARRVRTAYSRTLCLPCLRQVFCASNTTATEATMSSPQFLTFCVYVSSRWFAKFLVFFRDWLFRHVAVHGAFTGPTGWIWRLSGVVFLPRPLTGHKSPHRAEFGFCLLTGASQTGSPPSSVISGKILGRRKIIPPSPLKNHSAKFATPCKRFSNPLKKSPLLCLCGANFAVAYPFARR